MISSASSLADFIMGIAAAVPPLLERRTALLRAGGSIFRGGVAPDYRVSRNLPLGIDLNSALRR